jgi:hypothetical protein
MAKIDDDKKNRVRKGKKSAKMLSHSTGIKKPKATPTATINPWDKMSTPEFMQRRGDMKSQNDELKKAIMGDQAGGVSFQIRGIDRKVPKIQ